jgi:hypothetical protein
LRERDVERGKLPTSNDGLRDDHERGGWEGEGKAERDVGKEIRARAPQVARHEDVAERPEAMLESITDGRGT